MNKQEKIRTGTVLGLSAATLWAITIIITKLIVRTGENPINIVFWLTVISMPYWLGLFISRKEEVKNASKKDYLILLSMGVISTLLISLVEILALKYTLAINYAFLIRCVMLFTIGFAAIFLNEKITTKKLILVILILTGAYFVATGGKTIHLRLGDGLTLLEAALIAFGNTILGKIATKTMSSELSSSGSFLFGFIPVIFLAFVTKSFSFPNPIGLIVLLSAIGILAMTVRFKAYKYCSASFLSMIYSLTPVVVTILAFFVFGEKLTLIQFLGGLLVISGGIFAEKIKL